jgi:hypothetical protein
MTEVHQIKSGDLLVWSGDKYSRVSDIFIKGIRVLTKSQYGHTAIAWRLGGHLFAVEATIPSVRLYYVKEDHNLYHVPVNLEWGKESEDFLLDKLGLQYSVMDDVRAYFGAVLEDDDRWQCAELVTEFYKLHGIHLNAYTPSAVVENLLSSQDTYITKVK